MAQSANVSPTKGFATWQALTKALFDDYRPEVHYMRGPGPKWHEKHDRAEIDGASPAVTKAVTKALRAGLRPRVATGRCCRTNGPQTRLALAVFAPNGEPTHDPEY